MSIVGTRPPLISETNLYEPRHKVRLAIKPGITGMWQVSGRSDITDFEEVVRLDKEYIENWDIGLDIKILLKTVMVANNFVSYASLVAIAINSMACRYISVSYNSNRIEEAKSYFCSVFIANCFLYGIIVVLSILFIGKIELIISISPELVLQVTEQLKILTIFFTVPYAGIIAYGKDFLKLWLRATEYTESQYTEIYVLMILVLLDIIISLCCIFSLDFHTILIV